MRPLGGQRIGAQQGGTGGDNVAARTSDVASINLRTGSPMCGTPFQVLEPWAAQAAGSPAQQHDTDTGRSARAAAKSTRWGMADRRGNLYPTKQRPDQKIRCRRGQRRWRWGRAMSEDTNAQKSTNSSQIPSYYSLSQ